MEPITDEHEAFEGRGFAHIPHLRPGDKVRWRNEALKDRKLPELGATVTVYQVFEPGYTGQESGTPAYCGLLDFSVLFRHENGRVVEYAFDSRRFEPAE